MFRTILATVLTLSAITAAPVLAAPADAVSATVSYADLNLASPAGVASLQHRVEAAAKRICGTANPMDVVASMQVRDCRKVSLGSPSRSPRRSRSSSGEFARSCSDRGLRPAP